MKELKVVVFRHGCFRLEALLKTTKMKSTPACISALKNAQVSLSKNGNDNLTM